MSALQIIQYIAMLMAAVMLGRWFSIERNRLLANGESWYKTWLTIPGIVIIVVFCVLITVRIVVDL